jgi:hypothetical protein
MKSLHFDWQEEASLVDLLSRRVDRLVVEMVTYINRPVSVRLIHDRTVVLDIRSRRHDVAERIEVGVLQFRRMDQDRSDLIIDVPATFGSITAIEKLVIVEQEFTAESGVAPKNGRGEEIVIVAGVCPYTLALQNPWDSRLLEFRPEYRLERYNRIAMT